MPILDDGAYAARTCAQMLLVSGRRRVLGENQKECEVLTDVKK
jgi:hypothetical protein